MAPKQQRPPTGASETLDNSLEIITGLEIDTYFGNVARENFISQLTTDAANLGIKISNEFISYMYHAVELNVGQRIAKLLTKQQLQEIALFTKNNDKLSSYQLLMQFLPDLHVIVADETQKARKYLKEIALQKSPEGVKDKGSMGVETQQIIEQARAETRPPQAIEHPAPDTKEELATVAGEVTRLASTLGRLRGEGLPLTKTEAEIAISGLHDIATRSDRTAWQLGLHAVEQGLMSQVELAKLLDTSSPTVSRRYRESPEQPDEPQA